MRIEAGVHPAAAHITAIYLNGEKVEGLCQWADPETGEIGRFLLDSQGAPIVVNDDFVVEVLHGIVQIEIPDEHKHWLAWAPAGGWQPGDHPQ